MFPQRKFQSLIIREDQRRFKRRRYVQGRRKSLPYTFREKIKKYLVLFLETSSIHGLNHLVAVGRHPCEIFLWFTMVFLSVFGTVYLSWSTWARYQSSPTVVSMERDMYSWNTTFPCVTLCPEEKLDPTRLDTYLESLHEDDKENFKKFIKTLANTTFENFNTVPEYKGIDPDDYLELLLNLSALFKPTLVTSTSGFDLQIIPTITEMGLCYTINSKVAIYNTPEYRKANRWDVVKSNTSFNVHPLDGEVFSQVNITHSYFAYIHGPYEAPDITAQHYHSPEFLYMTLYVHTIAVYTSPEAARLTLAQRGCRFHYENNLKHNPVYSYNFCRTECRIQLSLKYCQCIPYFYRKIDDEKICNVKGLHCLHKHKDIILGLRDQDGKKVNCSCPPLCNDVNYIISMHSLQGWAIGTTTLQWGMVAYPRMRFKRDIIFGFTDVLVAVGGMAGLFLGCSVLSFAEIIYFFTLRLICYTKTNIKK
ncbi:sodium channel protein Nach-like [Maniola jurtina]|uniref:sodium channel protein Nach-like n=1 Tax=Maniola jurtina TaxID=191418 RepID=UPI001E68E72C|nr:sodium channel protein Nach-like [Maniola jurtina]